MSVPLAPHGSTHPVDWGSLRDGDEGSGELVGIAVPPARCCRDARSGRTGEGGEPKARGDAPPLPAWRASSWPRIQKYPNCGGRYFFDSPAGCAFVMLLIMDWSCARFSSLPAAAADLKRKVLPPAFIAK